MRRSVAVAPRKVRKINSPIIDSAVANLHVESRHLSQMETRHEDDFDDRDCFGARRPLQASAPNAVAERLAMMSICDGKARASANSKLPKPESRLYQQDDDLTSSASRRAEAAPFTLAGRDK